MRLRTWACLFAVAASGCTTTLEVQTIVRPEWQSFVAHPEECAFTVYWDDHRFAPSCREIGDVFVGDTGFSVDCGWDRVMETVRSEACRVGAQAGQIVRHREPELFGSACDQVRARLVVCEHEDAS